MTKTTLSTATVLAFERHFDVSDGLFFQTKWNHKNQPQEVIRNIEKSVRGTISNRLKTAMIKDPLKLNSEIEKANLQKVDMAALDHENDTLVVKWTCKVLPFTGTPCVCNDANYQVKLEETIRGYINQNGFTELARRYAMNIANARFLWRNRMGAENIEVLVKQDGQETLQFNARDFPLDQSVSKDGNLEKLTQAIELGLSGERFALLHIEAYAKVGSGQEVYPSQELVLDTSSKDRKSKILYSVGENAAMHSQKISNALRTIDTWYPDAQFPIAVEPYGAVTTRGTAFRQPAAKTDFYNLFDDWILRGEVPSLSNQHYVIATLIRGGVFGGSGKE